MPKLQPIDQFLESSIREAIRSLLKRLEETSQPPEMVDRLLALMRELRKPTLDELSGYMGQLQERHRKTEEDVEALKNTVGLRQPTPRPMGPVGMLQR